MTTEPAAPSASEPALVGYTTLCLTALMVIVVVLMENEREPAMVLLLAAVGAIGVVARWRAAPPLLLLGLAALELYHQAVESAYFHAIDQLATGFTDVALSAAVLVYSAGQYRLVALKHSAFPVDTRWQPAAKTRRLAPLDSRQQRSSHLIQPWEAPALAVTAVGWAVAVSLFWLVLSVIPPPLGLYRHTWRGLLLIFTVGLTTALAGAVVSYLGWIKATPAEHRMFLQDQAWRETRGEQNQINRWLTWARLRGQRRKEKT